jgi:hypothetical protein
MTTATSFTKVLIGITPAGCYWYARRPEHVAPMRAAYQRLCASHTAKAAARASAAGGVL